MRHFTKKKNPERIPDCFDALQAAVTLTTLAERLRILNESQEDS